MLAASTNVILALVCALVGAVIAVVVLIQSKLQALIAWSALIIAIGLIFLTVKAL